MLINFLERGKGSYSRLGAHKLFWSGEEGLT